MSIVLACLALNELEWLPAFHEQHKAWPGVTNFVYVEAADVTYAEVNPDMVTSDGLSMDGTTEYLTELERQDERVIYVPHGFSRATDRAQGKTAARNRHLEVADEVQSDFVFVLDADEFYTHEHQARITRFMSAAPNNHTAFMFGLRTIWRPPSIADQPLFALEAVGCLFSVPICRGWRHVQGSRYTSNHNTPCGPDGTPLLRPATVSRFDREGPYCVHMGFTSSLTSRRAKAAYYVARGEGRVDGRRKYVDCRHWFETYQPGDRPPHGVKIIPYAGEIPEVFKEEGGNAKHS